MSKRDAIRQEFEALYDEGVELARAFQKGEDQSFQYAYQRWYTSAIKVVASIAPDRSAEFRSYYEIDPKRKQLGYGTFVIQDFMKGVVPSESRIPDFDSRGQALSCFFNQITIFKSIGERLDSALSDIEGELFAELQDGELTVARQLSKVSLRAAGSLVGVVIEGHLQKVAMARGVKIKKKNPTISDLNEPLKAASVIDLPAWRKISYLADLRNLCSHKKDVDPTKEQIEDLIQGAEWLVKNVF